VPLSHRKTNVEPLSCRFMKFFLDWAKTVMGLFKLAWAQFECQHMPPVFRWMMHDPENIYTKPNSDDTHLVGYLVTKGDVYIGHFCSKDDTCIDHCLESTSCFLPKPFQAPPVNCSWETITLQRLQLIWIAKYHFVHFIRTFPTWWSLAKLVALRSKR